VFPIDDRRNHCHQLEDLINLGCIHEGGINGTGIHIVTQFQCRMNGSQSDSQVTDQNFRIFKTNLFSSK